MRLHKNPKEEYALKLTLEMTTTKPKKTTSLLTRKIVTQDQCAYKYISSKNTVKSRQKTAVGRRKIYQNTVGQKIKKYQNKTAYVVYKGEAGQFFSQRAREFKKFQATKPREIK